MKSFIYFFISRPVSGVCLLFSLYVSGILALYNISIELTPQAKGRIFYIVGSVENASPLVIEANIVSKLEASLSELSSVKRIRSSSYENGFSIEIELEKKSNVKLAKVEISEKIFEIYEALPQRLSLPKITEQIPPEFQEYQGFLTFSLSGNRNSGELRKFANEIIKPKLLAINGVANVDIFGGGDNEIQIAADKKKLEDYKIGEYLIFDYLSKANSPYNFGKIATFNKRLHSKAIFEIQKSEDIIHTPLLKTDNGRIIKLKDLATVNAGYSQPNSFYRINGKESVVIEISKKSGYNSLKTADEVFRVLRDLQYTFPPDFVLKKEIDKTENIREEVNGLFKAGIWAFLITSILIFIFFRKFFYSIILLSSILSSLIFSMFILYAFGISLNLITIFALVLSFGLYIDNSIVVIDYIEKKWHDNNPKKLSVLVKEVFFPVFASCLTTVAIFLPIIFFSGELKDYLSNFVYAITISCFASLFVSFAFIPSAYFHLDKKIGLRKAIEDRKPRKSVFEKIYRSLMKFVFLRKKIAISFLILSIGLPLWLLPRKISTPILSDIYDEIFGSEFYRSIRYYVNFYLGGALNIFFNELPRGEAFKYETSEKYLTIDFELPANNSFEKLNEISKIIENEIMKFKDHFLYVKAQSTDINEANITVAFDPQQAKTIYPYVIKNHLIDLAQTLSGLGISISGFGQGYFDFLSAREDRSISLKLSGFNYSRLDELAHEVKKGLERNPRIRNVRINKASYWNPAESKEIVAFIDKNKLLELKIPFEAIQYSLLSKSHNAFSNFYINFDAENYSVKIITQNENSQLPSIEEIAESYLIYGNNKIKFKEIASFELVSSLSSIRREQKNYIRYVWFDYIGYWIQIKNFLDSFIKNFPLPQGYSISLPEGEYYWKRKFEEKKLNLAALSGIVLIFMITASLYNSFKKPFLVIFAIPLSFIGAIYFLYFFNGRLDRGAYAGALLLIGVAVNNSILLVDYLSKYAKTLSPVKIIKLSFERARPIFITSLTTISSLAPFIFIKSSDFMKNLAITVCGGMLFSSFLILIFLPLIYFIAIKKKRRE